MPTNLLHQERFWLRLYLIFGLGLVVLKLLPTATIPVAQASEPITAGYRDFYFGPTVNSTPTGEKPESKLWWNDGFWWGSLWDPNRGAYYIHKLDLTTQDWVATNTALDNRNSTKADVLWDGQHLYVVSHQWSGTGSLSSSPVRLYRYSYNPGPKIYTQDGGFPVTVAQGQFETTVVDRDSTGRLWITFVASQSSNYKVWVNHSLNGNDSSWGTPYVLPMAGATGLSSDDISSLIAYQGRIGVMWSNQNTSIMYFAVHQDTDPNDQNWQSASVYNPGSGGADDHINLKSLQADSAGNLFAVTKTSFDNAGQDMPLILLLACTSGSCTSASNWQAHTVYRVREDDTRPILLIDTTNRKLHVITTGSGSGGEIHHKVADMDNIQFPVGEGEDFIKSATDSKINNATSTKQNLNSTTHLVVLASDQDSRRYFHNCLSLAPGGGTCTNLSVSPPTVAFSSGFYSVNENDGTATVTVNLSHSYTQTITVNYTASNGLALAGADYTATSGTLTFNPNQTSKTFNVPILNDTLDEPDETINLTLTNPINNASLGTPSSAMLTIVDNDSPPGVRFSQTDFSLTENDSSGHATIIATLSQPSGFTVTVAYTTANGTATAGSDYTAASGTLTFNPGETATSFAVPIDNDGVIESSETVNLALSSPNHATLSQPSTAVLTILEPSLNEGEHKVYLPILLK